MLVVRGPYNAVTSDLFTVFCSLNKIMNMYEKWVLYTSPIRGGFSSKLLSRGPRVQSVLRYIYRDIGNNTCEEEGGDMRKREGWEGIRTRPKSLEAQSIPAKLIIFRVVCNLWPKIWPNLWVFKVPQTQFLAFPCVYSYTLRTLEFESLRIIVCLLNWNRDKYRYSEVSILLKKVSII